MPRILLASILFIAIAIKVPAQTSASAYASVAIVHPDGANTLNDLNFEGLLVNGDGGSVVITTESKTILSGSLKYSSATNSMKAATLGLLGPAYTFAITLPSEKLYASKKSELGNISVANFRYALRRNNSSTPMDIVSIGATLEVEDLCAKQVYKPSLPLQIIINYN